MFVFRVQMKLSVCVFLLALLALSSAGLQDIVKKSSQLRKGELFPFLEDEALLHLLR